MTGEPPAWSACGIDVRRAYEHAPQIGIALRFTGGTRPATVVLVPELARSLAHWLLYAVGDRPEPADPDRVRLAIEHERQQLLVRHRAPGVTPEAESELAWAFTALDAIAAAAREAHDGR